MCECILGKTTYQYQLRILELETQLAGAYRDARVALIDAYEQIAALQSKPSA